MPTTKRRIPVTLPADIEAIIESFAEKNNFSLSQSITLFLRNYVDTLEDDYWAVIADDLDENQPFISAEEFWDKIAA